MTIYIPAIGEKNSLETFEVQCIFFTKGDYNIIVTGMVAENIIETVNVAFSIIKQLILNGDIITKNSLGDEDYHIHFTNGSIIKEGTSAGLGVLFSILKAICPQNDNYKYLVTGEIDLFGKIHEVGGIEIKANIVATSKFDRFIFPRDNYDEMLHSDNLRYFPIDTVQELLELFFQPYINRHDER